MIFNVIFKMKCNILFLTILISAAYNKIEARESVWAIKLTQKNANLFTVLPNYMFENSFVTFSGICQSDSKKGSLELRIVWILMRIDCVEELYTANTNSTAKLLDLIGIDGFDRPQPPLSNDSTHLSTIYFQLSNSKYECVDKKLIELQDESNNPYYEVNFYTGNQFRILQRMHKENVTDKVYSRITRAWEDGMYHFLFKMANGENITYAATVSVALKGAYGFISAAEYPMFPVFGLMSILYLLAATIWIILWAKAQEHTKKIHVVIGAIAVAGGFGNTFMFADLSVRNADGMGVTGIHWIGEIVSTCQLSLTNLLLMIVSTGYGINRPSLTQSHTSVMIILTALSFVSKAAVLVVSEENMKSRLSSSHLLELFIVIFSIVMLLITCWIMVFSVNTFIYLYQRRHSSKTKLIIFSLFMGCCVTVFITHLALSIYLIAGGIMSDCHQNWKYEWIVQTVTLFQVFGLLVVLMWLWRPVDENKTYAFQPLSTEEEHEAENSEDEGHEKIMLDLYEL